MAITSTALRKRFDKMALNISNNSRKSLAVGASLLALTGSLKAAPEALKKESGAENAHVITFSRTANDLSNFTYSGPWRGTAGPAAEQKAGAPKAHEKKSGIAKTTLTTLANVVLLAGYLSYMIRGIPREKRDQHLVSKCFSGLYKKEPFFRLNPVYSAIMCVNNVSLMGVSLIQAVTQGRSLLPHVMAGVITAASAYNYYIARKYGKDHKPSPFERLCGYSAAVGLTLFGYSWLASMGVAPVPAGVSGLGIAVGGALFSSLVRAVGVAPLALDYIRTAAAARRRGQTSFPTIKGQVFFAAATCLNLYALSLPLSSDAIVPIAGAVINTALLLIGLGAYSVYANARSRTTRENAADLSQAGKVR